MLNTTDKIIKHKTGLLKMAVLRRCLSVPGANPTWRYHWQAGHWKCPRGRVDDATEQAVIKSATDFPAYGQARTSNELRKLGVFVSPSGVRSIWLRHDLANFKVRLKALEAKVVPRKVAF